LFGQADTLKADYAVIPISNRVPPSFELLKVFDYQGPLASWDKLAYGLYKRSH